MKGNSDLLDNMWNKRCLWTFFLYLILSVLICTHSFLQATSRWTSTTLRSLLAHDRELEEFFELSSNPKHALQEVCHALFQSKNPTYSWSANGTLVIRVPEEITVRYPLRYDYSNRVIPQAVKKEHENNCSLKMMKKLHSSQKYHSLFKSYISQRLNRDNQPIRLSRDDMLQLLSTKALVVLVDAENIADFKKIFYFSGGGDIRFLSPCPPPLRVAPSLLQDSSGTNSNSQSQLTSADRDSLVGGYLGFQRVFRDEETLILSYAHHRGPQSIWANRIVYSTNKDAADGAIQLMKNVKKVILITGDKFALNAEVCFNNDNLTWRESMGFSRGRGLSFGNKILKEREQTERELFLMVPSCAEAALAIGRVVPMMSPAPSSSN